MNVNVLELTGAELVAEHTGNVDFLEMVAAVSTEEALGIDRDLVLEVLNRPLAYEALADGTTGITVGRIARLTGLSVERAQVVLKHLVADGTLARGADGRIVAFTRELADL